MAYGSTSSPPLAEVCQACEGRGLISRTMTKKRWLIRWKVQRFRLCWACAGTARFPVQNRSVSNDQEVNMAGQHRKTSDTKKKECRWCKGKGGFQTGDIYLKCGRCLGSGERK